MSYLDKQQDHPHQKEVHHLMFLSRVELQILKAGIENLYILMQQRDPEHPQDYDNLRAAEHLYKILNQ